jgi:GNAT superfamily N-acetyltransferase
MVTIRKAIAADIELLRSLAREIWNECYPGIISAEQISYMLEMMYSRQVIDHEMSAGVHWHILEDDAQSVGFLAFADDGKNGIKLNKLYVQSGRHGKGLGQKALNYVVEFAEQNGFQNVYLTVNKKNLRAMAAYERKGFVRSESIVSDIGNGYVMDDFVYKYQVVKN